MTDAHFNLGVVYLAIKDKSAALEQHLILKTLNPELATQLYGGIYRDKLLIIPNTGKKIP